MSRKKGYSRMVRAMARRATELRQERDAARRCVTALGADPVPADHEPPFAPRTLVAYAHYDHTFDDVEVRLALTALDPTFDDASGGWSYGLHFVQFPESGRPSGGSMYSRSAKDLRLPTSPAERLAAARYHSAARLASAKNELQLAQREQDAMETAMAMLDRKVAS